MHYQLGPVAKSADSTTWICSRDSLAEDLINHAIGIQDHARAEVVHIAATVCEIISEFRKDPSKDLYERFSGWDFNVSNFSLLTHDLL